MESKILINRENRLEESENQPLQATTLFNQALISYSEGVDNDMYKPWYATISVLDRIDENEEHLNIEEEKSLNRMLRLFVVSTMGFEKISHGQYVTLKYGILETGDVEETTEEEIELVEEWSSRF